ncbi:zinc finger protein 862-like [Dreissena polymorpha]|uniref:zinc finger protein 862-like n=1 Tax=Dreissena polymorpha TaxID=45954 RepID=UPI002264A617|nr:zinc finger protein 862-like [Dreissena polymorpha]
MNLAFLQDIQLPNGTADVIYSSIKDYMKTAKIDLGKMTSFASDGPSVMVGNKNGVVAQIQRDNPRVIPVHCINHLLQLAVSKAFSSVTEIDAIDELLTALWKYYHFSTVKSGSLDAIQDLIRELGSSDTKQNLTVKKAVHTRWLSHENAVQSIRKLYEPICMDLENAISSGRDKKLGDHFGASASVLLKLMKKYDKLYYIHLLCDICTVLARLTLLFERADVDLSSVQPQLESTVVNLQRMKTRAGPFLSKVSSVAEKLGIEETDHDRVQTARNKFIDTLLEHLQERLDHSELITAMAALDFSHVTQEQIALHGEQEIIQLAGHLQLPEEELLAEWADLKVKFHANSEARSPKLILKQLSDKQELVGDLFPNIKKLLCAYETLILSTAAVERLFSQVKLIVTEHRNRLEVMTTNKLLIIKLNTKSHCDIDMRKVVKLFLKKKRRIM